MKNSIFKNSIPCGFITVVFAILFGTSAQAKCVGKFVNPITDICWSCLFPITIGGAQVSSSGEDTLNLQTPLCTCPMPVPPYQRVGFPVSFWEPARLGGCDSHTLLHGEHGRRIAHELGDSRAWQRG